jgi:amylosucrase
MGDEIGLLNDHSYEADPDLAGDGRWMHRPFMDWDLGARLVAEPDLPAARLHRGVRAILAARRREGAFAAHVPTRILDLGEPALFAYLRADDHAPVACVFNFTERPQRLAPGALGLEGPLRDLLSGAEAPREGGDLRLAPYAALWLRRAG